MNFKPRDSKVICSSVSCEFDRFLICWLRDLMFFRKRFFSLIFRILLTVGNVDRDIGRYSGRHSVDSGSILGRRSVLETLCATAVLLEIRLKLLSALNNI